MNYNFKKSANTEVKTTHDRRAVSHNYQPSTTSEKISMREGGLNAVQTMGLESALGKDERLFQLKVAIQKGQAKTLTAAANLLGLGAPTVRRYIRELNNQELALHLELWDDKKNKTLA